MRKLYGLFTAALGAGMLLVACDRVPTQTDALEGDASASASAAAENAVGPAAMMNSSAPFRAWHQGFDHRADGWITDAVAGPGGWCGDIEQVGRRGGAVEPSAGSGYATVAYGACNDFWQARGFPASGPYSPGAGFSSGWPSSGFVQQLDIYLDAEMGTTFWLIASVNDLDDLFHYFPAAVTTSGGSVMVTAGGETHEVQEAGWYTFRYVFGDTGGDLAVTFELTKEGRDLFTTPIASTLGGTSASELQVSGLGSGYLWFHWFAAPPEGLTIPIDEHQIRHGS